MSTNTDPDDGIDIQNIEPGDVPVYRPEIDGPEAEVEIHGAATGDAGPMLFHVDVKGHGFYLYGLTGIREVDGEERFAVVADHLNNSFAEAAIEAMGGVVVDE
jgi:hypothetical protein